ncbi:MAG: hypothetical protein Roseis2KO_02260 [Roseivirga sp.]
MSNDTKTISQAGLNQTLLDLRMAVMRGISDVWKNHHGQIEPGIMNKHWRAVAKELYKAITGSEKSFHSITEFNNWLGSAYESGMAKKIIDLRDDKDRQGYFRKLVEYSCPENLKQLWKAMYRLDLDYPSFGVHIIDPTARWNYYGDNQWTKPATEVLYLSLPAILPKENSDNDSSSEQFQNANSFESQYQKASIVTSYYKHFPSFLGFSKAYNEDIKNTSNTDFLVVKRCDNFPPMNEALELKDALVSELAVDPYGNNYDLGIAADQFQGFSAMSTKVLAVMWSNESIRKRLDYAGRLYNETTVLDKYAKNQNEKYDDDKSDMDDNGECKGQDNKNNKNENKPDQVVFKSLYEFSFVLQTLSKKEAVALHEFDRKYTEELNAILKRYFQYEVPWVFKVRIMVPESGVFFRPRKEDEPKKPEYIFEPNKDEILNLTTIEIPHAPGEGDTNNVALALARYNATGPAYPFTCS